ncbi:hypothetical protein [Paraburkholderia mimosarum]|uniref:hypothetical protein n=1 Tax=Paraburkholderia mimosarum TaxID=312026 RepID=UPI0012DBE81B|nr:hypothetical protein [Paraburkholderia mimosarum]
MHEKVMARLWVFGLFCAIAADVTSGALRYYTAMFGVPQLTYLPKALMLIWVVLRIADRPKPIHLWIGAFLAVDGCIALANGVDLDAVMFWMWVMLPMFFALLAPPEGLELLESRAACIGWLVLAVVAIAGVLINYYVDMPWLGESVDVGAYKVTVAADLTTGDVKRLAGLGRSGAGTGLLIGLLTIWLVPRSRSRLFNLLLPAFAFVAIWGTTNKTMVVALLVAAVVHACGSTRTVKRACLWTSLLAFLLPAASFLVASALNNFVIGTGAISSFQDRVGATWPNLVGGLMQHGLIWLGTGAGGFGTTARYYPANFGFDVSVADNMALYAVAAFGLFGAAILTLLMLRYVLLGGSGSKAQWCMLLVLLLAGLTTDIFESPPCLLFFGVLIRYLANGSTVRLPSRSSTGWGGRSAAVRGNRNAAGMDVYESQDRLWSGRRP